MLTPLHQALGLESSGLDMGMIEAACAEHVAERSDLDWKKILPLTEQSGPGRVVQQEELAKDIAAQANSGGGMIVFGVDETRGSSTSGAESVVPVGVVEEPTLKAIRQVAGNLISPPVTTLDLQPIFHPDRPEAGVLVMLIPDSGEAPHLVHPKGSPDWFGAPYRNGPDTHWMLERQLATAYREREQQRRTIQADLEQLYAGFVLNAGATDPQAPWIIAVARPDRPASEGQQLNPGRAHSIIQRAVSHPSRSIRGPLGEVSESSTRRGLRLFTRQSVRAAPSGRGAAIEARVEIHSDGAVAVGLTRSGALNHIEICPGQVPIPDFEAIGLDLLSLLLFSRASLGVVGDYVGRIGVEPTTQVFRRGDSTSHGLFVPFRDENRVRHYQPVDGPMLSLDGTDSLIATWLDIVNDAINQTGVQGWLSADDIQTAIYVDDR